MKLRAVFAALMLAFPALAGKTRLPALPPPDFADAEVSANMVLAPFSGSCPFVAELSLEAAPTNCVELAFGCDCAPSNGVLSAAESAFAVGWDCGRWFLAAPGLANRVEAASASESGRQSLRLRLDIREDGGVRKVTGLAGGAVVFDAVPLPDARGWDLARATRRGCAAPDEILDVRVASYGTVFHFR